MGTVRGRAAASEPLPRADRAAGTPGELGTSSGARRVIGPADPDDAAVLGDRLLFAATTPGAGRELWSSDGATATLVRDIRPGAAGSDPRDLVTAGGQVFFVADDGETGAELWRTDGTEAGTRRVADIWPGAKGSLPVELTAIGDELWFSASDGVHGYEPWHSDGTGAGTVLLDNLIVGSGADNGAGEGSAPLDFTADGDAVWFRATAPAGSQRLMRTDGTPESLETFVVTGPTLYPWTPGDIAVVGGHVFLHNGRGFAHSDARERLDRLRLHVSGPLGRRHGHAWRRRHVRRHGLAAGPRTWSLARAAR